ncbi:MAG: hypothetical protein JW394_0229 [Nitrospira sp.]|nr:hypothetical protein [Nitrospira sp.]
MFIGPHNGQQPLGLPLSARQTNHLCAAKIAASQRVGILHDFFGRALGNDPSALCPSTRPHIQQMVRCHHGFRIMLDHYHRIAQIAQTQQSLEQSPIVSLMKADRRLVENVENANEA